VANSPAFYSIIRQRKSPSLTVPMWPTPSAHRCADTEAAIELTDGTRQSRKSKIPVKTTVTPCLPPADVVQVSHVSLPAPDRSQSSTPLSAGSTDAIVRSENRETPSDFRGKSVWVGDAD
jgi:hypothetical protein